MKKGVNAASSNIIIQRGKNKGLVNRVTKYFESLLTSLDDNDEDTFKNCSKSEINETYLITLAIFHKKPKFALWLHNQNKDNLAEKDIINFIQNACLTRQIELIDQLIDCPCVINRPYKMFQTLALSEEYSTPALINYFEKFYVEQSATAAVKSQALCQIFKLCVKNNKFDRADAIIKHYYNQIAVKNKNAKVLKLIETTQSKAYQAHCETLSETDDFFIEIQRTNNTKVKKSKIFFDKNFLKIIKELLSKGSLHKNISLFELRDICDKKFDRQDKTIKSKYKPCDLKSYIEEQNSERKESPETIFFLYLVAIEIAHHRFIDKHLIPLQKSALQYAGDNHIDHNLVKLLLSVEMSKNKDILEPLLTLLVQSPMPIMEMLSMSEHTELCDELVTFSEKKANIKSTNDTLQIDLDTIEGQRELLSCLSKRDKVNITVRGKGPHCVRFLDLCAQLFKKKIKTLSQTKESCWFLEAAVEYINSIKQLHTAPSTLLFMIYSYIDNPEEVRMGTISNKMSLEESEQVEKVLNDKLLRNKDDTLLRPELIKLLIDLSFEKNNQIILAKKLLALDKLDSVFVLLKQHPQVFPEIFSLVYRYCLTKQENTLLLLGKNISTNQINYLSCLQVYMVLNFFLVIARESMLKMNTQKGSKSALAYQSYNDDANKKIEFILTKKIKSLTQYLSRKPEHASLLINSFSGANGLSKESFALIIKFCNTSKIITAAQLVALFQNQNVPYEVKEILIENISLYGLPIKSLFSILEKEFKSKVENANDLLSLYVIPHNICQNFSKLIEDFSKEPVSFLGYHAPDSYTPEQIQAINILFHIRAYEDYINLQKTQNTNYAGNDKDVKRAKDHFNKTIAPRLGDNFAKEIGTTEQEKLLGIESKIRTFILNKIINQLQSNPEKSNVVQFIEDNKQSLATAQNALLMDKARELLCSTTSSEQIAWRALDANAPTKNWPNLFSNIIENETGEATDKIYSTVAASGGVNIKKNEARFIIRKMLCFSFLAYEASIDNSKNDAADNYLATLIEELAEIRRTHNTLTDPAELDSPSCFPGTITRLIKLYGFFKDLAFPLSPIEQAKKSLQKYVVVKFSQALAACNSRGEKYTLIEALSSFNMRNAEEIIINHHSAFIPTSEHMSCRHNFIQNHLQWGNEKQAINIIENLLQNDFGSNYQKDTSSQEKENFELYVKAIFADLSYDGIGAKLCEIYNDHLSEMSTDSDSVPQQAKNPFTLARINRNVSTQMRAILEKQNAIRATKSRYWDVASQILRDNGLNEDYAQNIVEAYCDKEIDLYKKENPNIFGNPTSKLLDYMVQSFESSKPIVEDVVVTLTPQANLNKRGRDDEKYEDTDMPDAKRHKP